MDVVGKRVVSKFATDFFREWTHVRAGARDAGDGGDGELFVFVSLGKRFPERADVGAAEVIADRLAGISHWRNGVDFL